MTRPPDPCQVSAYLLPRSRFVAYRIVPLPASLGSAGSVLVKTVADRRRWLTFRSRLNTALSDYLHFVPTGTYRRPELSLSGLAPVPPYHRGIRCAVVARPCPTLPGRSPHRERSDSSPSAASAVHTAGALRNSSGLPAPRQGDHSVCRSPSRSLARPGRSRSPNYCLAPDMRGACPCLLGRCPGRFLPGGDE